MKPLSSMIFTFALLSLFYTSGATSDEFQDYQTAHRLFEQYVALGKAFDPAMAELYTDDAKIQNTRTYPNGKKRTLTIPATQYKTLIRNAMWMAKARGDINEYMDIKYAEEGSNVRITAIRHSHLKNYDSPLSLLVGKTKDGAWKILEEISESIP